VPGQSFEEFAHASLPTLSRYAYALTGTVEAGDDLVQDTLVKVARAWRRVRGDGNPVGYARTTMLHTYLSRWRMLRRRPVTVPLMADADHPPGSDAYAAVDARDQVRRVLATLPRDQRAVLVLGYLDDLPDDEIAALLHRRPATVRSLRHRALTALRRQVAEERMESPHGPR
jgi:RNA polymerase sigma-70 factor (sigma-E family)